MLNLLMGKIGYDHPDAKEKVTEHVRYTGTQGCHKFEPLMLCAVCCDS
jgi:hypothetical protein